MYTPLHLVPPSVPGLISSIENKYKINASNIRFLYRYVCSFIFLYLLERERFYMGMC